VIFPNPQRVPLGTDVQGRPVLITREWLRFLEATTGTTDSGGVPVDLASLQAQIVALQTALGLLTARVVALETKAKQLGYQV
jgi:hypothetical protein